ncbi:unnamed protein product [Euphydryas editha]|uniref:DDE-1 domain-containing protein n=1 Tax=Euphydryas editha TaxID=104508 RepID=A0AAU9TSJ9_EUPED|nr:unnamed protein product [Euphydryas editha]
MPRSKNKVTRPKPIQENVKNAIEMVIQKRLTIRKAAEKFNVSKSLIGRYVKLNKEKENVEVVYRPQNAVKRVFSDEEERQLVEYCLKASKFHYGICKDDFLKLAFEYAIILKKTYPSSWDTNKKAGKTFYAYFIKRHQNLSLRKPEPTSLARATAFNKANINLFFDKYKELLLKYNFTSERIYNVDESGISTVHTPMKVLASKGAKQVGNITSAERGNNVTIIACVNALGNSVPPCMIFPRVHFKSHMTNGAPPETLGMATPSGWSNSDKFEDFLQHFIKHVRPTNDNKVLLIMDNHESHISIKSIELAKKNGIVMFTFPPHTSHKLQPLDRTVFGPLKKYYNKACNDWLLQHPGTPLTIYNVAECFGTAFPLAFTPSNIQNGFKISGIWPFNDNIFSEDEFLSSYVTDRPFVDADSVAHTRLDMADTEPNIGLSGTSQAANIGQQNVNNQVHIESPAPSTFTGTIETNQHIPTSPEVIRPFLKAPPRKNNTNRNRKGKTRVLTDTPEKQELELLAAKKRKKEVNKKAKSVKKRVFKKKVEVSSSEDETDVILESDDSCDDVQEVNNCVGCGENYFTTSSTEDWIQCVTCRFWVHEDCTFFENYCQKCGIKSKDN